MLESKDRQSMAAAVADGVKAQRSKIELDTSVAYLTVASLAKKLGIARASVHDYIERKVLKATMYPLRGKTFLIHPDDAKAFVDEKFPLLSEMFK